MNQQHIDPHRGTRGGAKLKFVAVAALAVAGFATYQFLWQPHSHLFHESLPPFAQKLFEPASFIYGSSIHVWAYKDDDGVEEIAVTGHADGPTCREMTGLVFNAYLEKQDRPDDLFVAGAARLIAGNVDHAEGGEALTKYKQVLADENLNERLLAVFARVPTEGTDGESGLAQMKRRVDEEKEQLKKMEADPKISQYVGIIKSRSSLAGFAREVSNLSQSSGLVELHTLPVALLVEARQRIKKTVASKTPTLVRFDDLLHKYQVAEAVMLQDVLRPGSGEPLVFRIPLNDLSADGFEEAKKLNRSEVESSMVGDAERRRRFYEDQITKLSEEKERCKHMSAAELREKIVLNQRCSPDGFCYSVSDDKGTTQADYCEDVLPRNLDIVHGWMGSVADLLSKIKKDQERSGDSRIETMNHATLVDSMLRDWDLPVARSQEAFDYWRKNRRGPVWKEIEGALGKLGVDQSAMAGEHLVFSVRVSGTDLLIQPVHILDLGRAVLVSDPKSNVTRVVDAWSEREPVLLKAEKDNPVDIAKELALAAVSSAEKGDINSGRDQLMRALAIQPESAFQVVEHSWATLFRDDAALRSDLAPKVKQIALRQERLAVIDSLFNSPDVKDDEKAFLQHLADALNADPGLPVDLHLALAVRIAQPMAEVTNELVKRGEQGHAYKPWQIVEISLNGGTLKSPTVVENDKLSGQVDRPNRGSVFDLQPDASSSRELLKKAAYVFEKYYDVDPDKALSTSLSIVKERAPKYLRLAMQVGSMPKQESDEMLDLVKGEEVSVVEWDAAELDGVQDQLLRRTHAEKAAEMLWSHKDVDPDKVNEELKSASQRDTGGTSPAFRSASERLKEFAKSGNKPDTLARVEIGQTIEAGAKELLLRAVERMKNRKTVYATVLSDHARLAARLSFEQNHYAEALDIMFPKSSPISLYHPKMTWVSTTDFAGPAESITANCEGGNLIVGTRNNGQAIEVIRMQGLPTSDACSLAKEVQSNWVPSDFGRVYERVLVTQVPLRAEAQSVRKLILEEHTRLALLKAMVFREIPPAKNLVPSTDSPIQEDQTKTVRSYRVPTVDETVRLAKSRFNATDN